MTMPEESQARLEKLPPSYAKNLVSIVALGVLVSAWLLRYTDLFEVVGGLLALTGAFSWIAFVSKVMPESRLQAVQSSIDGQILGNGKTFGRVIGMGLVMLVFASFLATIDVEALHEGGSVSVEKVKGTGSATMEPTSDWSLLPAGGRVRSMVWTSLWSPSRVRVKVSGLPDSVVRVWPFQYKKLQAPDNFRRPVLFVRPSNKLLSSSRLGLVLVVYHNNTDKREIEFSGQALWIGCDSDVEVPQEFVEGWKGLLGQNMKVIPISWFHPATFDGPQWQLQANDTIQVELKFKENRRTYACMGEYTVPNIRNKADFRRQVVLNDKDNDTEDGKCDLVLEIQ